MRDSAKRSQLEKSFALTRHTELQRNISDYMLLKKDYLIKTLLKSAGEEAIFLRGELSAIVKLLTILQPAETQLASPDGTVLVA